MSSTDRKSHWDKVYGEKQPAEVSWFQARPAISLEMIENAQLAPDDPIIDVGGGASSLVDELLAAGYADLTVLDVSGAALQASQHRLGDKATSIHWVESDVTQFVVEGPFALWHDRAVFHFLTDPADRRAYVAALKMALRPGGHLIIASFAIGGPEKCSGLPIVQYDADKLMAELGPDFRLVEQREETHITPAQHTQAFAYFQLIRSPAG